jgi:hypothetical protein
MLTKEEVQLALPANLRSTATDDFVAKINSLGGDPDAAERIRENFVGFATVLKDGKFKTQDYLNAVTYVSFKLMNCTNIEAWQKTFPKRHADLVARNAPQKDQSAIAAAYHRTKLVAAILEQSLIPVHVMCHDIYMEAIRTQARLMKTASSEFVQTQAAASLIQALKTPEVKKHQLQIDVAESSGMAEMREAMKKMAEQQQEMIAAGVPIKQIAAQRLIVDAEFSEVAK